MNFAIIGGDLRSVELANTLANDKNKIYTYGIEEQTKLKKMANIINCNSLEESTNEAQIIIGPIPFSSNQKNINTPLSRNNILIMDLLYCAKNKVLIAGNIAEDIYSKIIGNTKIIDIMKQEELTILNIIATAEGAIEVAMSNTDTILQGSNVLILGFGRIGKILSKKLEALSCNVTCSARKNEDLAWIKSYGYNLINTNEIGQNLSQYDIIINTIPHMILNEEKMKYVKKECLLIDLASKPGGIDLQCAKQKGIKAIWALALPGKVAPRTTAQFIKHTIYHIMSETIEINLN